MLIDVHELRQDAWFLARLSHVSKPRLMTLRRIKLVRNGVRQGEFRGMPRQHQIALDNAWKDIERRLRQLQGVREGAGAGDAPSCPWHAGGSPRG